MPGSGSAAQAATTSIPAWAGSSSTSFTTCSSGSALPRITAACSAAGATDALTLLQRARPLWIRARRDDRTGDPVYPLVIYNQQRLGEPATLRGVRAEHVLSMEYFSPSRAMGRYGTDGQYGVIVVTGR